MRLSTSSSNYVRPIPDVPWRSVLTAVVVLTAAATVAWELRARAEGYGPTLNDTSDLWAENRSAVKPDSIVLVGTSRLLFDIDLDEMERAFGQRPIQLAIPGSSPFPILANLAEDKNFRGTIVLDIVPPMFLAPAGPPMEASKEALDRYRNWTPAQRWSHEIGIVLERQLAFLKQEDLTLGQMLNRIELPERAGVNRPPKLPPYFYTLDRDRRARMFEPVAIIGSPLQQRVVNGWLPLFQPPPPPSFIPAEKFGAMMGAAIEARFGQTAAHIAAIRGRGGKVVFVRLPVQGPLVEREEQLMPLAASWDRLVRENNVAAINFTDHPELGDFHLPEWSHLSAPDSVEFTKRLAPHLQRAFSFQPEPVAVGATEPRAAPPGGR